MRKETKYPGYYVDEQGNVYGPNGRLELIKTNRGPLAVSVHFGMKGSRKKKLARVHVLVCETFHGPKPKDKSHVAHWDGNYHNNKAVNLRWATPEENEADKARHGRVPLGIRHWNAKVNPDIVREIRRRYKLGENQYQLAQAFGISRPTVRQIVRRVTWRHVA